MLEWYWKNTEEIHSIGKSSLPYLYPREDLLFAGFFPRDIYLRRAIDLYFLSWIRPYTGPPAEVLYKFTSLFCEAYTHGLNCGFNITDPNFHKSKPLQHLNLVYKHIVSGTCFSSHGSSPVSQKTLKSILQSLQTSTTVGLCWDLDLWVSSLKTWFPCVYSG